MLFHHKKEAKEKVAYDRFIKKYLTMKLTCKSLVLFYQLSRHLHISVPISVPVKKSLA